MYGQAGVGLSPQSAAVNNNALIEQKLKLEAQVKGAAGWFFWIAGLSLINSIVMLTGSSWHFFIGLGITSLVDAITAPMGGVAQAAALVINLFFIGILVLFGVFARKQQKWAFIVGMVLYGLDAFVLFLFRSPILPFGFHIFALFCMSKGITAIGPLQEIERSLSRNTAVAR